MDGQDQDRSEDVRSRPGAERDWARLSVLLRATTELRHGTRHWTVEGREPTAKERALLEEVTVEDLRIVALLLQHAPDGPHPGDEVGSRLDHP